MKFEISFEIAPGIAMELSVNRKPIIFYLVDTRKTFVTDGLG